MIAIALGQAIMSFNVASLPVSIGGMVQSFGVPPTTVGTGIVMYSLAVAGFVMLGAKLVQRFGATRVFRVVVGLFAVAQVLMTFSPVATVMLAAQGLAGLAAAVIVPALVALIANHYHGQQQATAVGALGSARAAAGVTAFLIGGLLGTFIGWRPVFGLLIVVSAIVFFLSFKLKPDEGRQGRGDRSRGRGAGRGIRHPDQLRLQQPQPLGPRRGAARRTVRPVRPVARAGDDRDRHRAAAGLHRLDPAAAGGGQDPAARPQGHHIGPGIRGGLCDVRRRRARGRC